MCVSVGSLCSHSLTRVFLVSEMWWLRIVEPLKKTSFENRGTTGVCLGHDSRVSGGVLVVSVVDGLFHEVCSAKIPKSGEKIGQFWRSHVHLQGI